MENEVPAVEQSVPSDKKNLAKIIIVVLGLVLILGALASAAYFSLERPTGLTEELMERGLFVSAEETYIYRDGSFVALETDGFQILESKQSNGHNAFIAQYENGAYSLRVDGEQKVTSVYPMRGLALSPEGTKVAYAEQMGGEMGSTNVADWKVTVMDLSEGGETRTYTESFSPYFLGDEHMVRFGSEGVTYVDLEGGLELLMTPAVFADVDMQTYQSPSRKALAWQTTFEEDRIMAILEISRVSPPETSFVSTAIVNPDVKYVLGDDGLYELHDSTVWVRTLDHPEAIKLYEIPRGLAVNNILLQ